MSGRSRFDPAGGIWDLVSRSVDAFKSLWVGEYIFSLSLDPGEGLQGGCDFRRDLADFGEDDCRPAGNIDLREGDEDVIYKRPRFTYLDVVVAAIPVQGRREELAVGQDVVEAAEFLLIGAQNDFVLSKYINTDSVVGVAVHRMEVEHKQQPSAFKREDLVALVFERDVRLCRGRCIELLSFRGANTYLRSLKPTVLACGMVHSPVKVVKVPVAQ